MTVRKGEDLGGPSWKAHGGKVGRQLSQGGLWYNEVKYKQPQLQKLRCHWHRANSPIHKVAAALRGNMLLCPRASP